jgi:hypothetical protein
MSYHRAGGTFYFRNDLAQDTYYGTSTYIHKYPKTIYGAVGFSDKSRFHFRPCDVPKDLLIYKSNGLAETSASGRGSLLLEVTYCISKLVKVSMYDSF